MDTNSTYPTGTRVDVYVDCFHAGATRNISTTQFTGTTTDASDRDDIVLRALTAMRRESASNVHTAIRFVEINGVPESLWEVS